MFTFKISLFLLGIEDNAAKLFRAGRGGGVEVN